MYNAMMCDYGSALLAHRHYRSRQLSRSAGFPCQQGAGPISANVVLAIAAICIVATFLDEWARYNAYSAHAGIASHA